MNYFSTLVFILFIYMSAWFVLSLLKKRNDVADVAWGLGFVLMTWTSFIFGGDFGVRSMVVGVLVSIWGIRLAWHIHNRNKGKGEDYRYAKWREEWGKWFYLRSYLQVYLLQGALLFLVALPVLVINKSTDQIWGYLDVAGVVIWFIGMFFEVVGDFQLSQFMKDSANRGHLMQRGLWRYTRHPNYFGEVMVWWGVWLIALSSPLGLLSIIGPITITVLLLMVSGIPMLEQKMANHPEFAEYKKRTSVFFPKPPKTIV